jgi:beta-glucanase (GH16 family)
MKTWTAILCAAGLGMLLCLACKSKKNPAEPGIPELEGWRLVWNDEFNGPQIAGTKWEHEVRGDGCGNNELEYYTDRPGNSFIRDGALVIQAVKETYSGMDGTRQYTSARMKTKNKGDWKYGRFEIRAKLPSGRGIWPAIWMMPTESAYGGWAASGEIDIMELLGHEPKKIYGTLHYGGTWPNNTFKGGSNSLPSGSFAEDFHVFTLEWDTLEMRWYMDSLQYYKTREWFSASAPENPRAPFDRKFYLILNVAVGGNWPGNPDASTPFPQEMVVDYVRVYERKN